MAHMARPDKVIFVSDLSLLINEFDTSVRAVLPSRLIKSCTESSLPRYVEQSNLLMEQRNTSLQMSNEHTQARVLHAEQEKVNSVGVVVRKPGQ